MFRDGGNTLGSSIIGNLGIGGKGNFALNQNYNTTLQRVANKESQENINIKSFNSGEDKEENVEINQQNKKDYEN